jgi:hypothetical protein
MLEVQKATLDVAGASRLDQIRAAMSGGPQAVEGNQAAGALEAGEAAAPVPGQQVGQPVAQPQPAERPEQGA